MLYYCNMVRWTRWDLSLILKTTTSFSALTLLVGLFDPHIPIPVTTYNVFSGTLNPAQSVSLRPSFSSVGDVWICRSVISYSPSVL